MSANQEGQDRDLFQNIEAVYGNFAEIAIKSVEENFAKMTLMQSNQMGRSTNRWV